MFLTNEKVSEAFETFGILIKDQSLVEKCVALCLQNDLDSEELAAKWLGYAATKHHDDMTADYLYDFERDVINRKKSSNASGTTKATFNSPTTAIPAYDASIVDQLKVEDDILSAYSLAGSPASKSLGRSATGAVAASPVRRLATPGTPRSFMRSSAVSSPFNGHLSPGVSKPSGNYSSRTNSGIVVASLNIGAEKVDTDSEQLKQRSWSAANFKPKFSVTCINGAEEGRIMFEKVRDTSALQEDAILHMADEMAPLFCDEKDALSAGSANVMETDKEFDPEDSLKIWSSFDMSNSSINCVGRVSCESFGRLNASSVVLEGSSELAYAQTIALDLSKVSSYAIFPGQIIGVQGSNSTGKTLLVDKLETGKLPPSSDIPITITHNTGSVQMVFACGPFTTTANLLFEPLQDMLSAISEDPPHALVLLGPILDESHPLLLSTEMTETYQAVVNRVINVVAAALTNTNTEVFIVNSCRDATSSTVYPTKGLDYCSASGGVTSPPERIHLISDPSLLVVEGVIIALTTVDVLMDLGKEELSVPSVQGDRLARLVQHVLMQQCLYPLNPPPEHLSVSRTLLAKHASLNTKPHIILLPSDIRNYVKEVAGCLAVNPERLCKGVSGGSYARVELGPPVDEDGVRPSILAAVYKV